ncbi:GNAT family N-acetyltransferase [Mycobacterium basiliense]|nr:GNAT family N-acetyltransferase [Mycobacterium basiliense]
MVSWPDLGTRVTVRYRRPAGSVPPLTDAVGQLLAVTPTVRVRTKTGAVVEFASVDVVALRVLTDAPVRTAEIRALEHAAAAGWPGVERTWLDGWLLRTGYGTDSAVPLDISATISDIPAILDWFAQRNVTPLLTIPDRLLPQPTGGAGERTERVMVRDVRDLRAAEADRSIALSPHPDDAWLGLFDHHQRHDKQGALVDALTAVVDGELAFGTYPGAAVARAAVTDAPDGTRWVGLSAVHTINENSGSGPAARLYEALLSWGARRGATRGYLGMPDAGAEPAESLGFRLHHRRRYVRPPDSL